MSQPNAHESPGSPTDHQSPSFEGQPTDQPPARAFFCKGKSLSKFCLIYWVSTIFVVTCFVAIYKECYTPEQNLWSWIFVFSLVFCFSSFVISLTIIIYSDYYQPEDSALDIEHNANGEQLPNDVPAVPEGSNSASIKSVHTILSHPVSQSNRPPLGLDNFINYTPGPKSPGVTVMDMRAKRKSAKKNSSAKKLKQPDEAGFSVIPTYDTINKDKKKKQKKKKKAR